MNGLPLTVNPHLLKSSASANKVSGRWCWGLAMAGQQQFHWLSRQVRDLCRRWRADLLRGAGSGEREGKITGAARPYQARCMILLWRDSLLVEMWRKQWKNREYMGSRSVYIYVLCWLLFAVLVNTTPREAKNSFVLCFSDFHHCFVFKYTSLEIQISPYLQHVHILMLESLYDILV